MKVGDLVKYTDEVRGMEGVIGLIVSYNGYAPQILWAKTIEVQTELPEFLEVINESR